MCYRQHILKKTGRTLWWCGQLKSSASLVHYAFKFKFKFANQQCQSIEENWKHWCQPGKVNHQISPLLDTPSDVRDFTFDASSPRPVYNELFLPWARIIDTGISVVVDDDDDDDNDVEDVDAVAACLRWKMRVICVRRYSARPPPYTRLQLAML